MKRLTARRTKKRTIQREDTPSLGAEAASRMILEAEEAVSTQGIGALVGHRSSLLRVLGRQDLRRALGVRFGDEEAERHH